MNDAGPVPRTRPVLVVVAIVVVVGAAILALVFLPEPRFGTERPDLRVYWAAIRTWFSGGSLYDFSLVNGDGDGQDLPFVYPPFSALILSPMALLGLARAAVLWTLVELGLVVVITVAVCRTAGTKPGMSRSFTWIGYLLVFVGLAERPWERIIGWATMVASLATSPLWISPRDGPPEQGALAALPLAAALVITFLGLPGASHQAGRSEDRLGSVRTC